MEELEADISHLLEPRDLPGTASEIVRGDGPFVLRYLRGLARGEDRADDVFTQIL